MTNQLITGWEIITIQYFRIEVSHITLVTLDSQKVKLFVKLLLVWLYVIRESVSPFLSLFSISQIDLNYVIIIITIIIIIIIFIIIITIIIIIIVITVINYLIFLQGHAFTKPTWNWFDWYV